MQRLWVVNDVLILEPLLLFCEPCQMDVVVVHKSNRFLAACYRYLQYCAMSLRER